MAKNEYAIEPTAFRDHRDLKYFFEKFGFHRGRLLVAFPSKWVRLVFEHLDLLPELERKRAVELLRKYGSDRVVPCGEPYLPTYPWVTNAARIKALGIVDDAIAAAPNDLGLPTVDEADETIFRGTMALVPAEAREYARLAKRLMQLSTRVVLVDPYFKISSPFKRRVLGEFLEAARSGCCAEIQIVCRHAQCWEKGFDPRAVQVLNEIAPGGPGVTIDLVDDSKSPFEMHARYLVSAKGALHYDKGFEEATELRFVPVYPVERELHEQLCHLYLDGAHGFEVRHRFERPARR